MANTTFRIDSASQSAPFSIVIDQSSNFIVGRLVALPTFHPHIKHQRRLQLGNHDVIVLKPNAVMAFSDSKAPGSACTGSPPPHTTTHPTAAAGGGSSAGPIIGAVVGIIVAVVAAILLVVVLRRRKHNKRPGTTGLAPSDAPAGTVHEIKASLVVEDELIEDGAYGRLFRGSAVVGPFISQQAFDDCAQIGGSKRDVAIKTLHPKATPEQRLRLKEEMRIMSSIKPHPNVVAFGAVQR